MLTIKLMDSYRSCRFGFIIIIIVFFFDGSSFLIVVAFIIVTSAHIIITVLFTGRAWRHSHRR